MNTHPKRRRSGKLSSGSTVIQALFENKESPLNPQFIRWKLWYSWPDYVGSMMAKCTLPVGYEQGTLYVWVKNSTWMHHLLFMKDSIRQEINQRMGNSYVKKIVLTLDRREVPDANDPVWKKIIDNIVGGENGD